MSPRILFELELEALKNSVKDMGKQVELVYNKLFESLVNKSIEEMEIIVQNDRLINDMQRNIEARCLTLLTKQQPVARDLRMVSAALKVVTDMERMGDHVSDMAELFLRMNLPVMEEFSGSLPQMVGAADKIIRDSLAAFGDKEIEKAKAVIAYDDVIDHYFNQVKEDLIMDLKEGYKNTDDCVDMLMITKYLEKIGDHAVNIGEWAIFKETGDMDDVRLL